MSRRTHAILGLLSIALVGCSGQSGAHRHAGPGAAQAPMILEGLGSHHQSVTTSSPEAQAYFDQGLRLVYAFNHIEAESAFREATRLDPACAMCYWGIALTQGSNYNSPTDAEREKVASAAIQEALRRADRVTPRERATIEALAKRHATTPGAERAALDRAYADAMREVARRFPDDLDAATLFADALMNLRPWDFWKPDGSMQPETPEILATLERVMRANPAHPGALHLYIHAVEGGPDPGRGEVAADRLAPLMPGRRPPRPHAGPHLPARSAATRTPSTSTFARSRPTRRTSPSGSRAPSTGLYYPHNIDFLWQSAQHGGSRGRDDPGGARVRRGRAPSPCSARCRTWRPRPPRRSSRWRGSGAGRRSSDSRRRPRSSPTSPAPGTTRGASRSSRRAPGRGRKRSSRRSGDSPPACRPSGRSRASSRRRPSSDSPRTSSRGRSPRGRARPTWRSGAFSPPWRSRTATGSPSLRVWYFPVRQSLGAALLAGGRPVEAEAVYRDDLERNPEQRMVALRARPESPGAGQDGRRRRGRGALPEGLGSRRRDAVGVALLNAASPRAGRTPSRSRPVGAARASVAGDARSGGLVPGSRASDRPFFGGSRPPVNAAGQRRRAACWSRSGRMRSRPSEGSGSTTRSIPAARYRSRVAGRSCRRRRRPRSLFGSRPARAARARRSASWARIASAPARPRGNQPSQNSTTRRSVCGPSPPRRTGGCGFCDRLGIGPDAVEADELPVKLRLVLRPDLLHGQHSLAHHAEARREGSPVMLDLLDVPAGAHAEEEAPVGEEVEAGHLLRGDDRDRAGSPGRSRCRGEAATSRPPPPPARRRGPACASTPSGGTAAGPGRAAARRDVGVLGHEERLEAALLEGARQVVDADRVLGREDEGADLHALPPRSERVDVEAAAPVPRAAIGGRPAILSHGRRPAARRGQAPGRAARGRPARCGLP